MNLWRSRAAVLKDPHGVSAWLSSGVVVGARVSASSSTRHCVVFEVEFDPPPIWALPGFPADRAMVVVTSSDGPVAIPSNPERSWNHRYPRVSEIEILRRGDRSFPLESVLGGLCLWYPRDRVALRWDWALGLDDFIRILQRHLWMEEFWRRTSLWPGEDAPHGERADGRPHPVLSERLRRVA